MNVKSISKLEQSAIKEFAFRLRDACPKEVDAVRLYGSKARGTSNKESDVDILIIVKKRTPALDDAVIDIVCGILNEFGIYIETVTMTKAEYRGAVRMQYPFAINVERDAITI